MNKLTCNLQGRLGNCMYEIAATAAIARAQGMQPCFQRPPDDYYASFPFYREYLSPILEQFPGYPAARRKAFTPLEVSSDCFYVVPQCDGDTMLFGFFQSWRYWDGCRKETLALFNRPSPHACRMMERLRGSHPDRQLVGVHVRRTDYVTDYGWELPLEYYQEAAQQFDNPWWVVFSDDVGWCKDNLALGDMTFIIGQKDYDDLMLLSWCDGLVIANSSFSTWAAMLGDPLRKKKIVAPRIWNTKSVWNADIHEPHWVLA